jgi:hypothetical protein
MRYLRIALLALALPLAGCGVLKPPAPPGYDAVPKSATVGLPEWLLQLSITYGFEPEE